jgi:hypothetical protein
VRSHEKISSI